MHTGPDAGRPAGPAAAGLRPSAAGLRPSAAAAWTGLHAGLWSLAWLLGLAWQMQQARLPPLWSSAMLAVSAAMLGLACLGWRTNAGPGRGGGGWLSLGGIALALALFAWASTDLRAGRRLAEVLPATLEGRDLQVQGVVQSLPRRGQNGLRFEFRIDQAWLEGAPVAVPPAVSLGWYGHNGTVEGVPALRGGQAWSLRVRLRRPHGVLNPQGFDTELWLFERGLGASGYVRAGTELQGRPGAGGQLLLRARQWVRDAIDAAVPDRRAAGVLAALAVGDQGAIERDDWDLFRTTGVAHLMSISGLHVTMFAWLAAALVGVFWRRSVRLSLRIATPQAARWGGLMLAASYALLAGWGVPAQRTLCMLAVVVLMRSLGRRWPAPLVLLAAAVVVSAVDPWALTQPGFWLSFGAVGLLMLSEPVLGRPSPAAGLAWLARLKATLRAGLHTQAVATVGLAPLSLLLFQQCSLVGFVANLVAIPLVTLLVTPLALLGMAWPWLWQPAATVLQGLSALLSALAALPGALWQVPAPTAWVAALGLLGGALLILPLPWRLRALGLPLLLPLAWPLPSAPPQGRFELVAVDVGQGTSVLLRTRRHLLVYDTGPAYSTESDAGDRILLPLLRARGEQRIHRLVLSHRDGDHVGGAASLMRELPVDQLSSSLPEDHALRAPVPGRQDSSCAAGQSWQWDGVQFQFLHPAPGADLAARSNALSCVLKVVDAHGAAVLLSGDIERAQETKLLASTDAPALASQVLMVPHHGSRTSSSAAFIRAVAPRLAFVQAAYRSRYGHPAPDVLARYRAQGVVVIRSDECGAWTWSGEGDGHCERERRARYWHHRP